jgi:small subunit ribosomal protein S8
MIDVVLSYKSDKSPKITNVQRISKPSRRIYIKSEDIKPFKNGFGVTIISTPAGVLSNKEAVKQKIGGEILFKIW